VFWKSDIGLAKVGGAYLINYYRKELPMSDVLDKAEFAERLISDQLEGDFDLKTALFFAINETDEGVAMVLAGEHGDVYDLLDSDDSRAVAKVSDYIALVTCGWASPIVEGQSDDEQVAPSQHPQRRRVRLMVFAGKDGWASVMRFSDTPDETITDDGTARGALAEAVMNLF
jgi:hypothetical protein